MSLKKFEILEMIAKGGMAEVYKAKTVGFQGFEKEVCVKKILPHLTEDDSFVTMFINEAKLAATLNYANIVQVHDLCVSANGEYFIVMEYVHGKDLSDVIRAAQLAGREIPPEVAVYVVREACKALYYAHGRTDPSGASLNIIHRDVSPHNVLVSFMGEVKLTDFGIAKASSIVNKTAVGILKGKYGYMSPEQARGQPLDHRSDIFNTGIVLYELLVGERCFAGSSDFSTLNLMRNAEVTPPTKINKNIPKELEAIVLKALSREPKDRFQDAMELERALAKMAKSSGLISQATDLGEFMQELFSNAEAERQPGSSTGVLNLSSVVGPPPKSADQPAAHASVPKKDPTPVAPDAPKDQVGKNAAARLKRKATKAKSAASSPAPEPKVEEKRPPARERTPPAAKAEAKKPEPEKREKKPARIKPAAGADTAKKKKGKQLSDSPKKPVGRKELRPGLTQIRALQGGSRKRTVTRAVLMIVLFAAVGSGVGWYRARQLSHQAPFRYAELASRDAPKNKMVTVLISSQPPGATVHFDGLEMSEVTPMALERDRDDKEHTIELKLAGHTPSKRTLEYSDGVITRVEERLEGQGGKLEISSKPEDLPVRIDGAEVGETPLVHDVAAGEHVVAVGGGKRELVQEKVTVEKGKTTKVFRVVPRKGQMASVQIDATRRAEIFVNGRATGKWTGDGTLELAPNVDHKLVLRSGKRNEEIVLKLKKGERKRLFLDLGGA